MNEDQIKVLLTIDYKGFKLIETNNNSLTIDLSSGNFIGDVTREEAIALYKVLAQYFELKDNK